MGIGKTKILFFSLFRECVGLGYRHHSQQVFPSAISADKERGEIAFISHPYQRRYV